jgi:signal transduction histidine kinase
MSVKARPRKNIPTTTIILGTLLPIIVFASIAMHVTSMLEKKSLEDFEEKQDISMRAMSTEITQLIGYLQDEVKTTATSPMLFSEDQEAMDDGVARVRSRFPGFIAAAVLLDEEKRVIAMAGEEGVVAYLSERKEGAAFRNLKTFSPVIVEEDRVLVAMQEESFLEGKGRTLRIYVEMEAVAEELVKSSASSEESHLFIVDRMGAILCDTDERLRGMNIAGNNTLFAGSTADQEARTRMLDDIAAGRKGSVLGHHHHTETDGESIPWMLNYYPIETERTHWALVICESEEEVYKGIERMNRMIWLTALAFMLMIVAIVSMVMIVVTKDLRKEITEKTKMLSERNASLVDEVQKRTADLEAKKKDLSELNDRLAREIEEKTKDLNEKVEQSKRTNTAMIYLLERMKRTQERLQESNDDLRETTERIKDQSEDLKEYNAQLLKAEESLQEKNKRLEELDEAKANFLNIVSHELKTPLTAMLAHLELVDDGTLQGQQKKSLEAIDRNSHSLRILIENILEISRIESKKFTLNPSAVKVRTLIEETAANLGILLQKKGLEVRVRVEGDPVVEADEARLKEILNNLFSNAIKFTEKGSVTIEASAKEDKLVVKVIDTGIGIPKEKMGSLFTKFYQVDPTISRRYGGTGLGLSITKQLVELHGGTMTVESDAGKGTTFAFSIPLKRKEQRAVDAPETTATDYDPFQMMIPKKKDEGKKPADDSKGKKKDEGA